VKGSVDGDQVVVYGASGHGKVVADILCACGIGVKGFIDDDPQKFGDGSGLKVLGNAEWLAIRAAHEPFAVALGVGDNFCRLTIAERCVKMNVQLLTAIHPSATIAASARISPGAVIMAHAVVNADAVIGRGVIINTAAIVEHDCEVGNFAHLSPKVAIGGHVQVGDFSWLGIGSNVIPNIKVGTGSIIGAGATVLQDVNDWVVAVGTPARILKELTRQV
jgi:sugar O-acyltransferase (sialic acid O-acetyltransferase NeuD family)